jgi:iron(III) transport system substrate-binding protein
MSIAQNASRSWPRFAVVAATAVLVAACSGGATQTIAPPTTPPSTPEPGTTEEPMAPRWGMTAEEEAAWEQVEAAADQEGEFTYYSVGSVPADKVQILTDAFAADYPNIKINYLSAGNNSAIVTRISTEQSSQVYLGDVSDFSYGNLVAADPSWFTQFSAPAATDANANWGQDPVLKVDGQPISTAMMTQQFGFWYNTDLVPADEAPHTYMDLCDATWTDQLAWRQPFNTGGGNHTYRFATEKYGDDWVHCLQAQHPVFYANQDEALLSVANGEFKVVFGVTGRQASSLIAEGSPIQVVWPDDIGVRVTNSVVILNNAPHLNAAKVFSNWMLTDHGQQMWADLGQFPVNLNVPPADAWQQGFDKSAFIGENLLLADPLQALLDKARGEFGGG